MIAAEPNHLQWAKEGGQDRAIESAGRLRARPKRAFCARPPPPRAGAEEREF
jgi:hypothetical protein